MVLRIAGIRENRPAWARDLGRKGRSRKVKTMSKHFGEFKAAYERLAQTGYCDSFGGIESHEVYAEWLESDRSATLTNLDAFIVERANSMDRAKPAPAWLQMIVQGRVPEWDQLTDEERFELIEKLKRERDAEEGDDRLAEIPREQRCEATRR
jgi:hypothetical protein